MFDSIDERLRRIDEGGLSPLLRRGRTGIEKESLRVTPDGHIAHTPHPRALGSALTHPSITTDYSEALIELITPPFEDVGETLKYLEQLHAFVYEHLGEELLWATSMPCMIGKDDEDIPIAEYGSSNVGFMKHVYRRGLAHRYGRVMQIIAGVHFNYSLPDRFWSDYQKLLGDPRSSRDFVSAGYFGLIRNFQRHGWLVPYLFGASPAVCRSFLRGATEGFAELDSGTLYQPYATSLRMSDIGYKNRSQAELKVRYDDLDSYVQSLGRAIATPAPDYDRIGVEVDGDYRQLNSNVLQIENEYYSFVRPKQIARSGERPILALKRRGVRYVEVRALDVSAFDPLGVNVDQMRFIEAFLIWCLLLDSPPIDEAEQRELDHNQRVVACCGRDPALELRIAGSSRRLSEVAAAIVDSMAAVCEILDQGRRKGPYTRAHRAQAEAIRDPERLPSARLVAEIQRTGESFYAFAMRLSETHKAWFAERPLSPAQRALFEEEARRSLQEQAHIESADAVGFDEYLRRYFAQASDEREHLLG